jgi:protein-histidine pros-kinase
MRLLIKFNLIFLAIFVVGVAVSGFVSRQLLQRNAQDETLEHARLTMEKAQAVRAYTTRKIKPLLETQMKYTFLSESVPAFAATEVLGQLAKSYPQYSYKEATLNPTNPRDRAIEWEADLIQRFRGPTDQKEIVGERETPLGRMLYIARPMKVSDPACLACHSTVDAAPRSMIDKYGSANGFGWQFGEVVGVQLVSVPMSVPLARAEQTFQVFMASLVGIFLAIGAVLNLMLWTLVIRPVTQLSALADRVSLGDFEAPEFAGAGRDEIGTLAASFSRMRRSMEQAMKMLDA